MAQNIGDVWLRLGTKTTWLSVGRRRCSKIAIMQKCSDLEMTTNLKDNKARQIN